MNPRALSFVLMLLGGLAACSDRAARRAELADSELARTWVPPRAPRIMGLSATQVERSVARILAGKPPAQTKAKRWKHVRALYKSFSPGPLWLNEQGLIADRGQALVAALASADRDALAPDQLPLAAVDSALLALTSPQPTADQVAAADVALTAGYVSYAEDMLIGQVAPADVSQHWHIDLLESRVDSALASSLRIDSLAGGLERMRPTDPGYRALRRALVRYRQIVIAGGWPLVAVGRSKARLAALYARLRAEHYLTGNSRVTANQLSAAVSRFQSHHGIVADGVVGPETVDAMNIPAEYRLGQIAANMERYRWLPRALGSRYILVNVPEFRLDVYDSGHKRLSMKVIVGSEYNDQATPVFSDSMEFVVFRPYWNVPDRLARNEIWPQVAAHPGFLKSGRYEVYHDAGREHVRQLPGGNNALGLVKFMFPNDFNIYLHDTPDGQLFQEDVRAFSHGCIRVEHPDQLAALVLDWPKAKVDSQMRDGPDNHAVDLPQELPVYILYFTAYGDAGSLYFGNDLYNRDDALLKAIAGGAQPTPQALGAEAALRGHSSQ